MLFPWSSHGEYDSGTDREMDRRQTVTLSFPLDMASITNTMQGRPQHKHHWVAVVCGCWATTPCPILLSSQSAVTVEVTCLHQIAPLQPLPPSELSQCSTCASPILAQMPVEQPTLLSYFFTAHRNYTMKCQTKIHYFPNSNSTHTPPFLTSVFLFNVRGMVTCHGSIFVTKSQTSVCAIS